MSSIFFERKEDKHGKVTSRGPLFILVSRHANFSSVWIQCDLLKKGTEHPEACNKSAHDGDPAKRLGICVRYRSKENGKMEEDRYKMETDSDMKKLNSLMNFCEKRIKSIPQTNHDGSSHR